MQRMNGWFCYAVNIFYSNKTVQLHGACAVLYNHVLGAKYQELQFSNSKIERNKSCYPGKCDGVRLSVHVMQPVGTLVGVYEA